MYLYVRKGFDLLTLPEALLKQFGQPELAMTLLLTPEKKLARVDVQKVIEGIETQDFFLQMPPSSVTSEEYMQKIPNSKLGQR